MAESPETDNVRYRDVEGILQVVQDGLCHKCGACVGICPANVFKTNEHGFPVQVGECINCNQCVETCSGASVDFPAISRWLFDEPYDFKKGMGHVREAYLGHATDEEVRWHGASGGVITQLLIHLLETGQIDGALVAQQDPADPALGKGFIAHSREELLASAQSRYTATPSLSALREIANKDGRYAVVGLPCQVHAVRKAQMMSRGWAKRISLLIGMFCYRELPAIASRELGKLVTPKGKKIAGIQYRESDQTGWPNNTVEITFTDGTKWRSPYPPNETVSLLSRLYRLGRCLTCLDPTAEFSDLAMADPWIRDEAGRWKYTEPAGFTSILVRTEKGESVLQHAVDAGSLRVKPIPAREIELGQYTIIATKKKQVPFRLTLKKLFRRKNPDYPLALPKPSPLAIGAGLMFAAGHVLRAYGPLRRFFLALGFSTVGRHIMHARMEHKKKRAVARLKAVQNKSSTSAS